MENPQNTKTKPTLWPSYTVPWICPEGSTFYFTDPCSAMLIAALITTAQRWRQSECPSTDEWVIKNEVHAQWNAFNYKEK